MSTPISGDALLEALNLCEDIKECGEKAKPSYIRELAIASVFEDRPEDLEKYQELVEALAPYEKEISKAVKELDDEKKSAKNKETASKARLADLIASEIPQLQFSEDEINDSVSSKKDNNGEPFKFTGVGTVKVSTQMEHIVELTEEQERMVIEDLWNSGEEDVLPLFKLDEKAYLDYDQAVFERKRQALAQRGIDSLPKRMEGIKIHISSKLDFFRSQK